MEFLGQGKILFSKNKTASLEIIKQILDKPLIVQKTSPENSSPTNSFLSEQNTKSPNTSLYKRQINLATCWKELARKYDISEERAKRYGFCFLQTQFPRDKVATRILNNPDSATFNAIVDELSEYLENDRILLLKLLNSETHPIVPGISQHLIDKKFLETKNEETIQVLKLVLAESKHSDQIFKFLKNNMYSNAPELPDCLMKFLLSNHAATQSNFDKFLELQPMIIKNSRKLQSIGFVWAVNMSLWQKIGNFQSSTNFQQILQNFLSVEPLKSMKGSKLVAEWLDFVLENVPENQDILEVQEK